MSNRMKSNIPSNFEDHQNAPQDPQVNNLSDQNSTFQFNPMQISAFLKEDACQGTLGINMNNDMRLQQLQQQLMMQQQYQMLQQQQQQQQQQQEQQLTQNNQLLRSLMNQKLQMPSYENQLQMQLLNNQGVPSMFQPSLLNEAQLLMQNNHSSLSGHGGGHNFSLPSPHELTLGDESRRMRGGVIEPFPEKLHRLLTEVEAIGLTDVISFIANGKAFAIHKPDKFFKEIVPKYFRQSRLSSFKRQLNLYGFELINTGPARGGYCHEMFVKDRPELCRRMRRVAIKVQGTKQQPNEKQKNQENNNSSTEDERSSVEEEKNLKINKEEGDTVPIPDEEEKVESTEL